MKIKKLDGMRWHEVVEFMKTNRHALALETTPHEMEAAKTAESHGEEAGAAVVVAYRFYEVYGAVSTAWRASAMYKELWGPDKGREALKSLAEGLIWSGLDRFPKTGYWPITPMGVDNRDKRGGLANVMFSIASGELMEMGTTGILSAGSINQFLADGMKKKEQSNE